MTRAELTTVATVHDEGSWLFTVADEHGNEEEILLVPCEGSVEAWVNKCTHEFQRLDRGFGSPVRNGDLLCPKHGSTFDTCSGYCDNGEAAETTLVDVGIEIEGRADAGPDAETGTDTSTDAGSEDAMVLLADDGYSFRHEGPIESDDEGPSSTSHLSF